MSVHDPHCANPSVVGLELCEGDPDGDELCTLVGESLGALDGRPLGLVDGLFDIVGCAEARVVGGLDGSELGKREGNSDGNDDGIEDGMLEGIKLGVDEGT
mmetsp:Transcript_10381/g.29195  ORF Transcript_10381/g.29195 Transcript_10381/m.29195 type:complete len:101 (+) Transcript_10381:406-708(+)